MRKRKNHRLTAIVLVIAVGVGIAVQMHQERLANRPSTPTPTGLSEFVVFYDDGASGQEWEKNAQQFKEVYLDTASIRENATIDNQTPPIARQIAQQNHVSASICISNYGSSTFNTDELQTILLSRKLSEKLVNNIATAVRNTPFTGINIDFEQLPDTDAKQFVTFLGKLHSALHQEGKGLSVDVPAETAGDKWDEGYNYAGIAKNADEVLIMTYDYSYPGGPAGPIAPVGWVKDVLQYAVTQSPQTKLRLGLPMYGYDWYGKHTNALTLKQIDELIKSKHVKPRWDATADAPYFTYTDKSGKKHTVYYENAKSVKAKLALAKQYRVPGVFTWYLGSENESVWNSLHSYEAQ